MKNDNILINENIKARIIVLIDQDGVRRGEFLLNDAITLSEQAGLDLVMVSQDERPVCKIMDYGKHIYDQKKKSKQGSVFQPKTKEIKIGYNSDDNYIDLKSAQAKKFIEEGHRVKVTLKFKGRQRVHTDIIMEKCNRFVKTLEDVADVQGNQKFAGNNVFMILSPKAKA